MNLFTQPAPHWFHRLLQSVCVGVAVQAVVSIVATVLEGWGVAIPMQLSAVFVTVVALIGAVWCVEAKRQYGLKENEGFFVLLAVVCLFVGWLFAYMRWPFSYIPTTSLFLMGGYAAASPGISTQPTRQV